MSALLSAAAMILGGASASAGTATFDFTADPIAAGTLLTRGSHEHLPRWRDSGGNPGGFLVITYPVGGLYTCIVFDDIDNGQLVKAFTFEADLRVGNSTGDRAADGFSVSFARSNDPVLADPGNQGNFAGGIAEAGTTTGIAVSFDTWSGNVLPDGGDIEGVITRVDNVTVDRQGMPTRHGACADTTSLQTGPRDAAYWADGSDEERAIAPESWAGLCWQPLFIQVDESAKLTVKFKNFAILENYQTGYFPSKSQLVLAGRTGGANEHTHVDNIKITTIPADAPIVSTPSATGCGFTYQIADAGTVTPVPGSIQVTLDGNPVTASVSYSAPTTTVTVDAPSTLASGSTHSVTTTFTANGKTESSTRSFTVPAYTTIAPDAKVASANTANRGFNVRVTQQESGRGPGDANSIANAERQLAGLYVDADNNAVPNIADLSGVNAQGFYVVDTVNWQQDGGDVNANNPDNFNSAEPADNPQPNATIPGIPTGDPNNISAEITAALSLPAGCHTLGVNSDDGFLVTVGGRFGTVLGSFNGGRGASDTLFRIYVQEAGVYPIRLSWWEGGGGADVEFFQVLPDGSRALINGPGSTIAAYTTYTAPGTLRSVGATYVQTGAHENGRVIATFVNGSTSVNAGSIKLTIDGTAVTPSVSTSGNIVTATWNSPTKYALGSVHNGVLEYAIGSGAPVTQNFSFTVRSLGIQDIPAGFSVEIEHFDFDGGQAVDSVSTMPYEGGEYVDKSAVHNIDYRQPGNEPASDLYRVGEDPNVPMDPQGNADLDTMRPGFQVTTNHKIGWAGGDWYNFTRTIPANNYKIVAAQSHGNAAGEANRLRASYGLVVDGHGTTTQSTVTFGSYSEPATGEWGRNALAVVKSGGTDTVVRLGGKQTLRVWVEEGDFDWFALVPTTERTAPIGITSSPADGSIGYANSVVVNLTDLARDTTVNLSSIKVTVDGQDVTSSSTVADTTAGASVTYAPAGGLSVGQHTFSVAFKNNEGTDLSASGSFTTLRHAGNFFIEAEDFNHGGGQSEAAASTMPLASNLYLNKSAVHEIDYHEEGNEGAGNVYRIGETPNVPFSTDGDNNRGTFTFTPNYRTGWVGGGNWWNYTRTIPAGNYEVWASLSHGDRNPGNLHGRLAKVTSPVNVADQTVEQLGTFDGVGTGGWGANRLIQMKDDSGNASVISLGGPTTLRYYGDSGDFDYLVLVPSSVVARPEITGITKSGANVTVTWTGGGTLEWASAVTGPWTSTGDSDGSFTGAADGTAKFYRVAR